MTTAAVPVTKMDAGAGIVAWVQWPGFLGPAGVTVLTPADGPFTPALLDDVTFYVPEYMGGRPALEVSRLMPNLRVLQLPNAGFEDALEFVRPGMTLCNAAGVHSQSTAELAVSLTLAALRGFPFFAEKQAQSEWRAVYRPALADSRVALVGYGSVGRTVGRMLTGFDVSTVSFSRRGGDGVEPVAQLPAMIGEFDVVILTVPLTEQTEGMFDAEMLSRMKDGALLVNVARGKVVDTDALYAELSSGRLCAALDVVDPEPLPSSHPLWKAPNCLITPHVGGYTSAFEPRARRLVTAQLTRLVQGEPLAHVVAAGDPPGGEPR